MLVKIFRQLIQKFVMNSDDQDLTQEAWYTCVITRALYNSLHEVRMKQQCYTVHTHPKRTIVTHEMSAFYSPPPLPPFSFILLKIWFGPINSLIWLKIWREAISLSSAMAMLALLKKQVSPSLERFGVGAYYILKWLVG